MRQKILLFDLDGVLIQPGGYRTAVYETINYFTTRMGLGKVALSSEVPEMFEALGITSEWDMVPICLSVILDQIYTLNPGIQISGLDQQIVYFGKKIILPENYDFLGYLHRIGDVLSLDEIPAQAVYKARFTPQGLILLPGIYNHPILDPLLAETRSVEKSITTCVFQNYVLGSTKFNEIYGVKPRVEVSSYLSKFDQACLTPKYQQKLKAGHDAQKIQMAVFTARNCLPPNNMNTKSNGYAPEAEMALDLLDFGKIPMIGYGKLSALASQLNLKVESLMKPAPTQALAALACACGMAEWPALQWARDLVIGNRPFADLSAIYPVQLADEIDLHVFEDSPIGIIACQKASQILSKFNIDIKLYAWGITESEVKKASLLGQGASVFPDVNQAVETVLGNTE